MESLVLKVPPDPTERTVLMAQMVCLEKMDPLAPLVQLGCLELKDLLVPMERMAMMVLVDQLVQSVKLVWLEELVWMVL
jgi:hypothetical protein